VQNRNRLIATGLGALTLAVAIAVWHARSAEDRQAEKEASARVQTPAAPEPAQAPAPAPPAPPPAGPAAAARNAPPSAPPPSVSAETAVARMNETVLMTRLRELAVTDSAQAIELARAGNKRFPDSRDAPERESILIHALVTQNQLSDARAQAEYMVNHYPDSKWVQQIEGFTGAHRHRNIRVNDAGQLEYY
jgi:hypothetical protein